MSRPPAPTTPARGCTSWTSPDAFDEINRVYGREAGDEVLVAVTERLASRARRRVQGQPTAPDPDVARQREVVDAFFAASRDGDFDALVAVLDPDVVLRSDGGPTRPRLTFVLRGPRDVTAQALASGKLSPFVRPALINGAAGVVVVATDRPMFVMAFTVTGGKIVAIDVLADPDRLRRLDLSVLGRQPHR
jgi:hypothetical protein